MAASADTDGRLAFAFRRVLGKPPEPGALQALRRMLESQRSFFQGDTESARAVVSIGASPRNTALDAAEHAALSAVCLGILNLDEALTRE
jgi:hypothetical protein